MQAPSAPEVALLVACAQISLDGKTPQRIQALSQGRIDWPQWIQLATEHGALGLLHRNLSKACPSAVPAGVRAHLEEQYFVTAGYNSFLARCLVKALQALAAGGVRAVPFKGPALAVSTYGGLALRHPGDLDILVRPPDLDKAQKLLIAEGYTSIKQDDCENHLLSADGRINVDLHWRLRTSRYRSFVPPARWWRHLQPISLAGTTVLQFAPEETFLILSANATKSIDRIRLGNVCDLAAHIHAHATLKWSYVREQARNLHCQRNLHAALVLAEDLYGCRIPASSRQRGDRSWSSRGLASLLRRRLFQNQDTIHPLQKLLHALWIGGGHRELIECLPLLLAPNDKDRESLPLPKPLTFLHFFVRPLRLGMELGRKTLQKKPQDGGEAG